MIESLKTDIRFIKGVGDKRAKLFAALNVKTADDLLNFYPRKYIDRSIIKNINDVILGESCTIVATICTPIKQYSPKTGMNLIKFSVADDTGIADIAIFNQPYLKDKLKFGDKYIIFGKAEGNFNRISYSNPAIDSENSVKFEKILPIYRLCSGLSNYVVKNAVHSTLQIFLKDVPEILPEHIREKYALLPKKTAINDIHLPSSIEQAAAARNTLAFEELYLLQLGLFMLKNARMQKTSVKIRNADISEFINALPYTLTNAQKRATLEAISDFNKTTPMSRLIQGDVGSGKTVVAAAIAYAVIKSGYQVSFMVPTEILAHQHYEGLKKLFDRFSINTVLLKGSMKSAERKKVLKETEEGTANLIIGTHALLSDTVTFNKLGLCITDEQHRFGTEQRGALAKKGDNPHVLIMSATPIPRTLGLIIYGDLDISIIDELPPGRTPVKTYLIDESMRARINKFIIKNVQEKRQVYIVCPLVEEGENEDLKSAKEYVEQLKLTFSDFNIALLHGKQKSSEKELAMSGFAEGSVDILVSTTVIEVGVDVKNATLMVIENAEKFGLSTLHQLRGRVGRGNLESFCIMFSNSSNEETLERLTTMTKTNDGFAISEKDLELRGPGDFFGTRQHGLPELKVADMVSDIKILKSAQIAAKAAIENDSKLEMHENLATKTAVEKLFEKSTSFA